MAKRVPVFLDLARWTVQEILDSEINGGLGKTDEFYQGADHDRIVAEKDATVASQVQLLGELRDRLGEKDALIEELIERAEHAERERDEARADLNQLRRTDEHRATVWAKCEADLAALKAEHERLKALVEEVKSYHAQSTKDTVRLALEVEAAEAAARALREALCHIVDATASVTELDADYVVATLDLHGVEIRALRAALAEPPR